MTEKATKLSREKPCPVCGYDLRAAAVGGRCPECGAEIRAGRAASRIPWTHRRELGRVRAYFATVWMVLRRPGMLAAEVDRPVVLRDARKFYWISMLLATVIAAGLLGGAYVVGLGAPSGPLPLQEGSAWGSPAIVLLDRWWAAPAFAVGLLVGMRGAFRCYRAGLVMGTATGTRRGRMKRLMGYMAACMPLAALLWGLIALGAAMVALDEGWATRWWTWIVFMIVLMGLGALTIYLWPTLAMIVKQGGFKVMRGMGMVVLFPALAGVLIVASIFVVFWVAGYFAMAVRSMGL